MNAIATKTQLEANTNAIATAKLATYLVRSFGGKGVQVDPSDFVPYPDALNQAKEKTEHKQGKQMGTVAGLSIDNSTVQVFFRLLATGQLPPEFAGQLGSCIKRWKQQLGG